MNTPRLRFSVMPTLLALLVSVCNLSPLNIVKVAARGLGHEWLQPRLRSSAAALCARAGGWMSSPLFRPTVAALVLGAIALWDIRALVAAPVIFGVLTEGTHTGEFLAWEAGLGFMREQITVLSGQNLSAGAVIGRVSKGVGRVLLPTVVGTGNGTVNTVFAGPEVEVGNYVLTNTAVVAHGGVWSLTSPSGKALPTLTMTPGAGGSTVYRSRHINFTIVDGSTDFALADAFTFVVSTTAPVVVGTGNGTVSAITLGPDAQPGNYRFEITAAITNGGEFKLVGPDGNIVEVGFIVAGAGGTFVGANKREINFTVTEGSTDFAVGDAFNITVFNQLGGGKVVAWDPTAVDGRDDAVGILLAAINATSADTAGVIITRDAVVVKSALVWGAAISAADKESAYLDLAARGIIARDGVTV